MPIVPINYLAVVACAVAAMVLGFLWYGPVFGKLWMKLSGMPADAMERAKSDPKMKMQMMRGYVLMFVGSLVMAFVLDHVIIFGDAYMHMSGVSGALQGALWSWLGFIAPVTLSSVLWEMKPWKLWILNNAYYLILLSVMGAILALWV